MLEGGWKTCASPVTLVVPIDIDQTNPEVVLHRWGVISHTLSPSPYYVQSSDCVEKCGPENPARLHKDHGRLSNVFPVSIYVNKLSRTKDINICTGESYIYSTTTMSWVHPLTRWWPSTISPLESDLVISEQKLRNLAETIGRTQGLISSGLDR